MKKSSFVIILYLVLISFSPVSLFGSAIKTTRMLTQPAISKDHIAFIYADHLWIANVDGSDPRRLTTNEGIESNPVFSPDGKLLAFSGQYNGNTDVYLLSVDGGVPKRLTWHPADDIVRGFTPDGKSVLFASQRTIFTSTITTMFTKLFLVSIAGGAATELEIPTAFHACYSPDGKYMAYTPVPEAFKQWKHYRGGQTSVIWLFSFADKSIVKIPKPEGGSNDTQPLWINDIVYFRSDRDGEFNLYSYNFSSGVIKRLTAFKDFPVLNISGMDGRIIFEQAGSLHIYDPASDHVKTINVSITAGLSELKPRIVKGVNYIRSADLSPSGNFAAFDFRGEIITMDAENSSYHNITHTTGVHEKYPVWSPDGKSIAYFSDASGEYKLDIKSPDEKGKVRSYKLMGTGFYFNPRWSPDHKKITYSDNGRNLYILDIESAVIKKIDADELVEPEPSRDFFTSWSPDSKWMAYTKIMQTHYKKLLIYSVDQQQSQLVTDGMSDASEPQFSRNGKYLYFFASTDAGPVINWFDQSNYDARKTNNIYLVTLQKQSASPFGRDSVKIADAGKLKIDWEGIQHRIVAFPVRAGNYAQLGAGADDDMLYMDFPENVSSGKLHRFSLKTRSDAEVMDMDRYTLSADGKKMLYTIGNSWGIANAGIKPVEKDRTLEVGKIEVRIDPAAEWANMFHENWRVQRDYFYDPGMHGADWPAVKKKYETFLPDLASRNDLNLLMQWMCSELAVGHSLITDEGDRFYKPEVKKVGLLGADYMVDHNRYRFKKIYGGLNWIPGLKSPLTDPGLNLVVNDYILAVNGKDVTASNDIYAYFEGKADTTVELTVGPGPGYAGSRTIRVNPIDNEYELRKQDWIDRNQQQVTEATNGQVAYVYVPNTAKDGFDAFKRYFYPQADRKAIIIDERFNLGGHLADYYINLLQSPYQANWNFRYGKDMKSPSASIQGPKVLLINESAGSGGDMFPWLFRKFNVGTLVGTRTWGGFVGVLGVPELLDGGVVMAPNLGVYTQEGWQIENKGIAPDIEVEQLPSKVIKGEDPQLQKAIEVALKRLDQKPPDKVSRPAYPVKVHH